jgi:hypothetical protein
VDTGIKRIGGRYQMMPGRNFKHGCVITNAQLHAR